MSCRKNQKTILTAIGRGLCLPCAACFHLSWELEEVMCLCPACVSLFRLSFSLMSYAQFAKRVPSIYRSLAHLVNCWRAKFSLLADGNHPYRQNSLINGANSAPCYMVVLNGESLFPSVSDKEAYRHLMKKLLALLRFFAGTSWQRPNSSRRFWPGQIISPETAKLTEVDGKTVKAASAGPNRNFRQPRKSHRKGRLQLDGTVKWKDNWFGESTYDTNGARRRSVPMPLAR